MGLSSVCSVQTRRLRDEECYFLFCVGKKTLHQIKEVAVFLKVHSEVGEHRFKLGSFQDVLWRARCPPFFPK